MLEKLKKSIQERIEKNALKIPKVTYEKKNGQAVTEDIVIKRSLLPLGDWQRIHPVLNEDGSLNIINLIFGGRRNFVKLLIILSLIGFFFLAYKELAGNYLLLREVCEPYLNLRI